MIKIELYPTQTEPNVLYLIVLAKTGIVYSNQCGGTACEEKHAEGFLVPIGTTEHARKLFDWFWTRYHGSCHCDGRLGLDAQHVQELKDAVSELKCWFSDDRGACFNRLRLDEGRLSQCCEAWIPVTSPFGMGYLTFRNSD